MGPTYEEVRQRFVEAQAKLDQIRAIAANNHIGGMSVPMSNRLIAIIDGSPT